MQLDWYGFVLAIASASTVGSFQIASVGALRKMRWIAAGAIVTVMEHHFSSPKRATRDAETDAVSVGIATSVPDLTVALIVSIACPDPATCLGVDLAVCFDASLDPRDVGVTKHHPLCR